MLASHWTAQYVNIPFFIRAAHLQLAGAWRDQGRILYGGAFNPPTGAQLIFSMLCIALIANYVMIWNDVNPWL